LQFFNHCLAISQKQYETLIGSHIIDQTMLLPMTLIDLKGHFS